ncbi:hypothetical protein [Brevundimonas naejangsanensis]|uniref:hypothetical protein n=1 Tax=Brevundimonas naejangsanensis TaxID=588932 RepID=UPI0032E47B9E
MKKPCLKPAHALSAAVIAAGLALSACSSEPAAPAAATAEAPATAQDAFFANLTALCGQRFEGKVVTNEAADSDFAGKRLLMHVRDCSADEIRIPFWVGEDRSRTWVVTRTEAGLRLKHDHRQPDGKTDPLHWYGGDTANEGTAERQEFPVDQESIDLFNANDASVSTTSGRWRSTPTRPSPMNCAVRTATSRSIST